MDDEASALGVASVVTTACCVAPFPVGIVLRHSIRPSPPRASSHQPHCRRAAMEHRRAGGGAVVKLHRRPLGAAMELRRG